MICKWLGARVLVFLGILCTGNGCQREVKLEPQDAVVTVGSKVKFGCYIPQCITADYPDTNFRMEHNGIAFGERTKTHENKNGSSIAFFERTFTSSSDAGVYTCIVSSNGQQEIQTDVNIRFVNADSNLVFVRVNNGTNGISCLSSSTDLQDLAISWEETSASCDISKNTKSVNIKSLKDVYMYRGCNVTSTKACKLYGSVANAVSMQAGIFYRRSVIGVEITQAPTGDLIEVTAHLLGPDAAMINTSWELGGQAISGNNTIIPQNETLTSVTVNNTVKALVLVHRLQGSELSRENILLDKPGSKNAQPLSDGEIAGIIIGIVVAIGILVVIVYMLRKKKGYFQNKTPALHKKDETVMEIRIEQLVADDSNANLIEDKPNKDITESSD